MAAYKHKLQIGMLSWKSKQYSSHVGKISTLCDSSSAAYKTMMVLQCTRLNNNYVNLVAYSPTPLLTGLRGLAPITWHDNDPESPVICFEFVKTWWLFQLTGQHLAAARQLNAGSWSKLKQFSNHIFQKRSIDEIYMSMLIHMRWLAGTINRSLISFHNVFRYEFVDVHILNDPP